MSRRKKIVFIKKTSFYFSSKKNRKTEKHFDAGHALVSGISPAPASLFRKLFDNSRKGEAEARKLEEFCKGVPSHEDTRILGYPKTDMLTDVRIAAIQARKKDFVPISTGKKHISASLATCLA